MAQRSGNENIALLTTSEFAELERECAREPIHIPGSIQPFGFLLALDPDKRILFASENAGENLSRPTLELIGQPLSAIIPKHAFHLIESYVADPDFDTANPVTVTLAADRVWHVCAHECDGRLILEWESAVLKDMRRPPVLFHRRVKDAIQRLQNAASVEALCQIATEEVRQLTGFGRVMVYKFDLEYNGQVIAESLAEGEDSYFANHFPASDIPPQARGIFLENWVRTIPDRTYSPVKILPLAGPNTNEPLDLSQSNLRSVSPVHLEYLKNMNVGSSLTISLKDEERLWGIIACHSQDAHYVEPDDRLACQVIGQLVSSQIRSKQEREEAAYRRSLADVHSRLISQMESEEDFVTGLVKYEENLLEIAGAEGAAAAIYFEGDWVLVGRTPTIPQIEGLVSFLRDHHENEPVFATDSLPKVYPPARDFKELASGLLAVAIPKSERNYLLWFRPEVVKTITWAGNPEKAVEITAKTARLHPRKSFEEWKQIVTERSLPWKTSEIEAVESLRNSSLALDLRRQFRKEQEARARAERVSREKEDILAIVSHDLKSPLGSVKLSLGLLKKAAAKNDSASHELVLKRVQSAVGTMEKLVHDILDIGKIEAGKFTLELVRQPVESVVNDCIQLLAPLAQSKQILLTETASPELCEACCDRDRVLQVLSNLVGNAIKFTPEGGQIEVGFVCDKTEVLFHVRDTGPGIPQANLEFIFDRFWQAQNTKKMGSGLGLAISKAIVESHGGRIWAESEVGRGTTFFFTLKS